MSETQTQTDDAQFNTRNVDAEVAWLAQDLQRVLGTEVMENDAIDPNDTDDNTVRWYKLFNHVKSATLKNSDDLDGEDATVSAYRDHFESPDTDTWVGPVAEAVSGFTSQAHGKWDNITESFNITGVVKVPEGLAADALGIHYEDAGVQPVYLPEVDGEVFDPTGRLDGIEDYEEESTTEEVEEDPFSDDEDAPWASGDDEEETAQTDDTESSEATEETEEVKTTESEAESVTLPDHFNLNDSLKPFIAADGEGNPAVRQEAPLGKLADMKAPDVATYIKVENPSLTNADVGRMVAGQKEYRGEERTFNGKDSYSGTSVANALQSRLGDKGYERLKALSQAVRYEQAKAGEELGEEVAEESVSDTQEEQEEEAATQETTEESTEETKEVESGTAMANLASQIESENDTINLTSAIIGTSARLAKEGDSEAITTFFKALTEVPESGN